MIYVTERHKGASRSRGPPKGRLMLRLWLNIDQKMPLVSQWWCWLPPTPTTTTATRYIIIASCWWHDHDDDDDDSEITLEMEVQFQREREGERMDWPNLEPGQKAIFPPLLHLISILPPSHPIPPPQKRIGAHLFWEEGRGGSPLCVCGWIGWRPLARGLRNQCGSVLLNNLSG